MPIICRLRRKQLCLKLIFYILRIAPNGNGIAFVIFACRRRIIIEIVLLVVRSFILFVMVEKKNSYLDRSSLRNNLHVRLYRGLNLLGVLSDDGERIWNNWRSPATARLMSIDRATRYRQLEIETVDIFPFPTSTRMWYCMWQCRVLCVVSEQVTNPQTREEKKTHEVLPRNTTKYTMFKVSMF